ncbi:MAG TPA: hypothetical protein PLO37_18420 [Candidatus Hydrogenedentes bacterium]|nr:hypothetical protein [Candidatus Hydrogenedentota bacterium]
MTGFTAESSRSAEGRQRLWWQALPGCDRQEDSAIGRFASV